MLPRAFRLQLQALHALTSLRRHSACGLTRSSLSSPLSSFARWRESSQYRSPLLWQYMSIDRSGEVPLAFLGQPTHRTASRRLKPCRGRFPLAFQATSTLRRRVPGLYPSKCFSSRFFGLPALLLQRVLVRNNSFIPLFIQELSNVQARIVVNFARVPEELCRERGGLSEGCASGGRSGV